MNGVDFHDLHEGFHKAGISETDIVAVNLMLLPNAFSIPLFAVLYRFAIWNSWMEQIPFQFCRRGAEQLRIRVLKGVHTKAKIKGVMYQRLKLKA